MSELTHSGFGGGSPPSMSTLEISDLTGKRHDHVMRDARKMLVELHGEEAVPKFGGSYVGQDNTRRPCFDLPKRETLILVSGYNLKMRAAIIDRWQELEAGAATILLPHDYPSALRALADKTESEQRLLAAREADAPKVAFADQITVAPDAIPLGQAAKVFDTGRNRFCQRLREIGWLTRTNEPYQDKINAGYLDVKISNWDHPEKGLQRAVTALVTGKGLAKLHQVIGGTAH